MDESTTVVELWQFIGGLGVVASGFWTVWRARLGDQRRVTEWRREVDARIDALERQSTRLDVDEHIRWRANVDASVAAGSRYDEQHQLEHGSILSGLGEIKEALAGMDKRLGIIESHQNGKAR